MNRVFDKIESGVIRRHDGWHIVLTFSHSGTGDRRREVSSRAWPTEGQARDFAVELTNQLADEVRG